jgi:GAF domain-containing protein
LAELFVVNGICSGTVFFLPDVPTVVGRSAECHVQIGDPWISSMHALFERRGGEMWVVDLDSRNGTFVSGERIHEVPLRPGVKLRFGKTEAEMRAGQQQEEGKGLVAGESTVIRYLSDLVSAPEAAPPQIAAVTGSRPPPGRKSPSGVTTSGRRQIQVINEIGRLSTAGMPLDETLRQILRTLSASVGAERASVLLLDERGEMVPRAVEPPGAEPGISATVVQSAIRSRAGILTFDAQQDARFAQSQSVIDQGIRSCMCAPIWAENRILGALLLDRTFTQPFNAEDLELVTLVGFQAAMAVDRVRLADRARAADEQQHRLLRHLPAAAVLALSGGEGGERDQLAPALRPEAGVIAVTSVGLAALAGSRPPDEVASRVLAAQEAVRALLLDEGAVVDARMTGGVVGVFGLMQPGPGTGGAAALLRCAVQARQKAAALEAQWAEPRIGVGLGVEVGAALAGNFGTLERPEVRAVGAAVEAALRLAFLAEPGQILVGPGAAQRAGATFELGASDKGDARILISAPSA